jgi:hypothetical protein
MNKEEGAVSGQSCLTNVRHKVNNDKHNIPITIKKTTMIEHVFRPTRLTVIQCKVKVKYSLFTLWKYIRGNEVKVHQFLTSALVNR